MLETLKKNLQTSCTLHIFRKGHRQQCKKGHVLFDVPNVNCKLSDTLNKVIIVILLKILFLVSSCYLNIITLFNYTVNTKKCIFQKKIPQSYFI